MTGYGRAHGTVLGAPTSIEVKSVNGRYLELGVRIPKEWSYAEHQVRECIREHIVRGSVNIYIRREETSSEADVAVNVTAAGAYVAALRKLQQELQLSGEVSVDTIANYAPAFHATTDGEADVWAELEPLIATAISDLNTMRIREGAALVTDMQQRLTNISAALTMVEQISAQRIPAERERLRERVRQLTNDEGIDEQRLQLEIILLSEKLDVNEECVRLRSHIDHYASDLLGGGAVGRKLNFLLQEMNREVNTIGSKASDAEIARLVVGMKEELERIREQVQNIE